MTADFGLARGIDAQSFGEPGQRTFRLRVRGSASQSASLWVEKEQLMALGVAIRQVLARLKYAGEPRAADVGDFPEVAEQEFRVGLMAMGFSPSDRTLILEMRERDVAPEEEPTLRMRLALEECASLAAEIDEIIARGRPICLLCGLPIDPAGHVCVRSNGHSRQPIPENPSGDDS